MNLREKLECAQFDIKKFAADREREDRLKEQVKVLTEQLLEAKRHHTPVRNERSLSSIHRNDFYFCFDIRKCIISWLSRPKLPLSNKSELL